MASGGNLLIRAKRIGLSQAEIARLTGLDKQTVQKVDQGGCLQRTVTRIEDVVCRRELEVARSLIALPHVRAGLAPSEAA